MRLSKAVNLDFRRFQYSDVPGRGAASPQGGLAVPGSHALRSAGQSLVTDAEVLQEILHRFIAIGRREAIDPVMKVLLDIVDDVFAVEKYDVLRAAEIAQNRGSFSARDAIHIAVMEHRGIQSILSFDADFDRWPGLKRITASGRNVGEKLTPLTDIVLGPESDSGPGSV